ncbi:MAG: hypothetical protein O7E57_06335, partial [Gammaproteobacteria bacterium]|nr:hypothetical protein [Gammaproteobacteria bacterium]
LYGYWFVVNLGGSLMDGKVVPERSLSEQWDGPWRGESRQLPNGWSVEFFLPWSMMAMPAASAERTMGFWVDRKVAHMDERYGWPALPVQRGAFHVGITAHAFAESRNEIANCRLPLCFGDPG